MTRPARRVPERFKKAAPVEPKEKPTYAVCEYCGSTYLVPVGKVARIERTCDMEPPASVHVWASTPGRRMPDYMNDTTIHACKNGKSTYASFT